MIGVILSGGQSSRMGQDKGLMVFDNKKWAVIVRDKLRLLSISTVLSINQKQVENYSLHFDKSELVIDDASLNIQGPLLGILSVHLAHPGHDLMVVACDMINMNFFMVKKLLREFIKLKSAAVAFRGERIEPLCAIYASEGLDRIVQDHAQRQHSMTHALEILNANYIPIRDEWRSFFKNYNMLEDVK